MLKIDIVKIISDYKDEEGDIQFFSFIDDHLHDFDSPIDLVNSISVAVAKSYVAGTTSYTDADDLMNGVFSYMTTEPFIEASDFTFPDPAYEIYDAFDAGEFQHRGDDKSVDPVAKYTDPAIRSVLNRLA